jgi:hypothetical protein
LGLKVHPELRQIPVLQARRVLLVLVDIRGRQVLKELQVKLQIPVPPVLEESRV